MNAGKSPIQHNTGILTPEIELWRNVVLPISYSADDRGWLLKLLTGSSVNFAPCRSVSVVNQVSLKSKNMATATVAPPQRSTRSIIVRWIAAGGLVLFLLVAGVAGWIYFIERGELPQVDGLITLNALAGPVTVIRDKLGVPHIRASSFEDLFFAQGFVTAQDRLWQMDASRRYAAGELAELLGPDLLKHDRQQRYLQIRVACERAAAALDP